MPHQQGKKTVAVLYGSQTGNAQSLAERIHEGCQKSGYETTLMAMNDWKKMTPELSLWDTAIFVVSTTGNGDAPENCDKFWRFIKRRAHPKDLLGNLKYTVLGLGDTNYDKFCYMGKNINTRLRELGASCFHDIGCADEATGLEDVVEPWIQQLWLALKQLDSSGCSDTSSASTSDSETAVAPPATSPKANPTSSPTAAEVSSAEVKDAVQTEVPAAASSSVSKQPTTTTSPPPATATPPTAQPATTPAQVSPPAASAAPRDDIRQPSAAAAPQSSPVTTPPSQSTPPSAATSGRPHSQSPPSRSPQQPPDPESHPRSLCEATGVLGPNHFLTAAQADPAFEVPSSEITALRGSPSGVPLTFLEGGADVDGERARWCSRSSSVESRFTADSPYFAPVAAARYLTAGGGGVDRRVVHLELSLGQSGIAYEPGDAIGMVPPNPPDVVEFMLGRLGRSLPAGATADRYFTHSCAGLPRPTTLRQALEHHLDLQAPPRKAALRALAEHCLDPEERRRLLLLSSKKLGGAAYAAFVGGQGLTVPELLEMFPSCQPPLGVLLGLLGPMPPRYYSIASSQLALPDRLAIAFSVVRYTLPPECAEGEARVTRRGLCSNWLEGLLAPYLAGEEPALPVHVPVFMKPTKEFLLPGSTKWPIVLIGPGTGVAPFMGFLQHRQQQRRQQEQTRGAVCHGYWRGNYEVEIPDAEDDALVHTHKEGLGDMWLFFGCRRKDEDWLYREEMEGFLKEGVLSNLYTAFSREGPEKVYVQRGLLEHGARLCDMVMEQGGYVFVCGDGNRAAQDIHSTLRDVLALNGPMTLAEAEATLAAMKQRGRYVLDVWS